MFFQKFKNDKGETITSRQGIANVFGEFHSKLFESNDIEKKLENTLSHDTRPVDEEKKAMEKITMKKTLDHR